MNLRTAYQSLRPKVSSAAAVFPLVIFRGATGGFPMVIGLYIAHRWGLRELGAYTVANAFVAVAVNVTDWGCSRLLPRKIALAGRAGAASFVAESNGARVILTMAVVVAVIAGASLGLIHRDVLAYTYLLLPLCAVGIFSTNAVSERVVSGEVHQISVAVIAGAIVFIAASVPLTRVFSGNGWGVVAAYLGGKCVETAILLKGRMWVVQTAFAHIARSLIALWPFSIQAILGVIYSRVPIFMIEHFETRSAVGLVSAGVSIRSVLLLLPASMALLSYPLLSVASRNGDRRRIREITMAYLWVCVAGVLAGLFLLGVFINQICLAIRVPPADGIFIIAFVLAGVSTIGTALVGVALQAFGGEHTAARLSFFTLALAIAFYAIAIDRWGVWGTVWGMVGAELTTLILIGRAALRQGNAGVRAEPVDPIIDEVV